MLSHADNQEDMPSDAPPSALRAQRLTPDESRAVIDLWQAERVEQTGLTDRPAVPDVAEGLDIGVEDVQRLLAEVRARRDAESRLLAHEQELAEIRLAEEQRKLAEIQRQRAELERMDAQDERKTGATGHLSPPQTYFVSQSLYTNAAVVKDLTGGGPTLAGFLIAGLLIVALVWIFILVISSGPQTMMNVGTYVDAAGKVHITHISCGNANGEVPCSEATIQKTLQWEQQLADQEKVEALATKKLADGKLAGKKKPNDDKR